MFIKIIFILFYFLFAANAFSQNYSIRTNIFNLVAKGPSVGFGYLKNNKQIFLTYSTGKFSPFFTEDYYKYSTLHLEHRWPGGIILGGERYFRGLSQVYQ